MAGGKARQAKDGFKECFNCKTTKPIEDFVKASRSKDGRSGQCKACCLEYSRKRRPLTPRVLKTADELKVIAIERSRLWYYNHQDWVRDRSLKKNYGISLEQFNSMFETQGKCCAICKRKELKGNNWAVDHDHITGRIRGILCNNCNTSIGLLEENRTAIIRMAEYLRSTIAMDEDEILRLNEAERWNPNAPYGPHDITPEMWADFESRMIEQSIST